MIVLDASVVVKLFKREQDSEIARSLMDHMLAQGHGYLAPSIILYEALSAALHVEIPFDTVGAIFERLQKFGFAIENPNREELAVAEKITTMEAPGGGYPTLFDSIYHAMAQVRGGTFITADARHFAKTRQFGHVMLLAEWRPG